MGDLDKISLSIVPIGPDRAPPRLIKPSDQTTHKHTHTCIHTYTYMKNHSTYVIHCAVNNGTGSGGCLQIHKRHHIECCNFILLHTPVSRAVTRGHHVVQLHYSPPIIVSATLPERWIGLVGLIVWPPRSLDLTLLHFLFLDNV
jgi:hypothetical protein